MKRFSFLLLTILLAVPFSGCRQTPSNPSSVSSTVASGTSTEFSHTEEPSTYIMGIFHQYLKEQSSSQNDSDNYAGEYIRDSKRVICATSEEALAEYRAVIDQARADWLAKAGIDPMSETAQTLFECVYEKKRYSYLELKSVWDTLSSRKEELSIQLVSLSEADNCVTVSVAKEEHKPTILAAVPVELRDSVRFEVGTKIAPA